MARLVNRAMYVPVHYMGDCVATVCSSVVHKPGGLQTAAAREVLAEYAEDPVANSLASMLLSLADEPGPPPPPYQPLARSEETEEDALAAEGFIYVPPAHPQHAKRSRRAWTVTARVRRARAMALAKAKGMTHSAHGATPQPPLPLGTNASVVTVVAHYGQHGEDEKQPQPQLQRAGVAPEHLRIATMLPPAPAPAVAGGSPRRTEGDAAGTASVIDTFTLPPPPAPSPAPTCASFAVIKSRPASPTLDTAVPPTAAPVALSAGVQLLQLPPSPVLAAGPPVAPRGRAPPRELRSLFGAWNLTGPSGSIADGVRTAMGEDASTVDPRMLEPHTRVKRRRDGVSPSTDGGSVSGSDATLARASKPVKRKRGLQPPSSEGASIA